MKKRVCLTGTSSFVESPVNDTGNDPIDYSKDFCALSSAATLGAETRGAVRRLRSYLTGSCGRVCSKFSRHSGAVSGVLRSAESVDTGRCMGVGLYGFMQCRLYAVLRTYHYTSMCLIVYS